MTESFSPWVFDEEWMDLLYQGPGVRAWGLLTVPRGSLQISDRGVP